MSPPTGTNPRAHRRMSLATWGMAILATGLIPGCSRSDVAVAPVQGTVTFNGIPARAEVVFQPEAPQGKPGGRPSSGHVQPDGTFRVLYAEGIPGALIGRHRVTVTVLPTFGPEDVPSFQQAFKPVKIVRLDRDVQAGRTNNFHFVLTY